MKYDVHTYAMFNMLIEDPKIKNNAIARKLGISEPAVARRRQHFEESGVLRYFTYVDNKSSGLGTFSARKLYILYFKQGITRSQVSSLLFLDEQKEFLFNKHVYSSHIGDKNGGVVLTLFLESRVRGDFVDILNGEILPLFSGTLGKDCIDHVEGIDIEHTVRVMHNYAGDDMQPVSENARFVSEKPK